MSNDINILKLISLNRQNHEQSHGQSRGARKQDAAQENSFDQG